MPLIRSRFPLRVLWLLALTAGPAAAQPTGEQIYQKKCASCHGPTGEGTKRHKPALAGDKSVAQLAELIAKTMPEDNPGTCTGPDAEKVAAYIHDTFYSREAREKNKPPRVELARLTVNQYRSAVADLIAYFRPAPKPESKPGLRGEYFASRNFRGDKRQIDRIDPVVKFDFGTKTPEPGKFEPFEFSIRWEGSVQAPETGQYEFVVKTDHALRLWVNDTKVPLIDAWVKSGTDTEFRGGLFLIAGRSYPLRLEFSKSQQGVNEPNKAKDKASMPASIALMWKLPGRAADVIPARFLSPAKPAEVFAPATPFPPDDRSLGWERGTTVSKAWDQATTDGAIEVATYVVAKLNDLAGSKDPDKVKDFARRFVERAFRRPLTPDEKTIFVDRQFEAAKDVELAVKRVVMLALKSPRFLYREAIGGKDQYAIASRLSFGLWDSIPDDELLKAAAAGKLSTREEVTKQAERMWNDPRAKAKLLGFLHTWLKVDHAPDLGKDPKRFPGFDTTIVTDLRSSLDLFLEDVMASPEADFRRLLLDESLHANGRLAKFYGADLPPDAEFQTVKLDPGQRAGVLTHPYLLAAFAYTGSTSPIHRGVFVARGVLGLAMRPPPEAFTPLPEDLHPSLTTRERVALQTKPANCQSCHSVINPLGFTLEKFDAIGRFRDKDNNKPVDATGQYQTRSGDVVKFQGVRELATYLANSEEVHASFAEQLFHHLVQQPVRAYGPNTLTELRQSFAKGNFNVRKLMVDEVVLAAMK
jgi:cytochrome c553